MKAHSLGSVTLAFVALFANDAPTQQPVAGADPETAQRAARAAAQVTAAVGQLEEVAAAIAAGRPAAPPSTRAGEHLADARRELVVMPERGLAIDESGVEFAVEDHTAAPIPGSQGRLEVVVGELTKTDARLEVRVFGGDVVVPRRKLAAGESLSFRFRDQVHELACVALHDRLRIVVSHDYVTLHVRATAAAVGDAAPSTASIPAAPAARPVATMLLALLDARIEASDAERREAEQALSRGETDAASAAIAAALARAQEARSALAQLQRLATDRAPWRIGDLAVVRAQVTQPLPAFAPVRAGKLDGSERALTDASVSLGDVVKSALGVQRLEVRVDEVQVVGKRYAGLTRYGKSQPELQRTDVAPGATVALTNSRPDTGIAPLAEGAAYWLALSPPLATKAIPRAAGAGDTVTIVFALPVVDGR